jgi:Flp pilus assembly protein TadB
MTILAVLCGLLTGVGSWLAFTGLRRIARVDKEPLTDQLRSLLTSTTVRRAAIASTCGLSIAVVTRWPVAGLITGLFVWAAPRLLRGDRAEARAQEKLEAIAAWTDAIRGKLRAYAGIEQALKDSAGLARPPIRPQATALAATLAAGVRLPQALSAFKAEVDHHAADLVAATLRQASARHSGNLAAQLGWLAARVRAHVSTRRRVETSRAESKQAVRLIVVIMAVVAGGLWLFSRPLLQGFTSLAGQLTLAVVGVIWTLATVLLTRLTAIGEPLRVLRDDPAAPATGKEDAR